MDDLLQPVPERTPPLAVVDPLPLPPGLPPLTPPRMRLLWWHGLLAMLLAVVMLIMANVAVGVVVLLAQHGVDGVLRAMGDPNSLISFPLLAAGQVANLTVFVLVAALVPLVAGVPHRSALGLRGASPLVFVLGAVGILGMGPLSDRIITQLKPFFPDQSSLELIEQAIAGQPLWVLVPILAVMPALGEELLCRGVLQRSIARPAIALPVSAVFFAALHMDPLHSLGVLPLGAYLAWLGHRTQSVWVPVFAHFINNLVATLAMHFTAGTDLASTEVMPLWAAPVGLMVTGVAAAQVARSMRMSEARERLPTAPPPELETPA